MFLLLSIPEKFELCDVRDKSPRFEHFNPNELCASPGFAVLFISHSEDADIGFPCKWCTERLYLTTAVKLKLIVSPYPSERIGWDSGVMCYQVHCCLFSFKDKHGETFVTPKPIGSHFVRITLALYLIYNTKEVAVCTFMITFSSFKIRNNDSWSFHLE